MGAFVRPAWAWPAIALSIVAVSLAPFLVVDVPAVLDYPNHLARFYVLAHPEDPFLSKVYVASWAILPNVGMDVIGQALLRVLPPSVGGRMLLAGSLLAPLAGAALYARAAFGRWTWWSLGAGAIAYNGIFILGFMNFLLGLGVALAGAGAWRLLRRRGHDAAAALSGSAIGLCAFFCHLLGYGFFAILIGAQEADELLRAWRGGRPSARAALSAAARLAVALGPAALLYLLTHHSTQHGDILWWSWPGKLVQWLVPFMIYDLRLTILTAGVIIAVVVLTWRRAERATGVTLALAGLLALYLVSPFAVAGGTFVDSRLPLMAALLLFAGVAPRPSPRATIAIAAAFGLLIVGRAALVAHDWLGRARDLVELRADLAHIPPGANVLPARTEIDETRSDGFGRVLPNYSRLDDHLAALALIERHAFWPLLFADPSQQPVAVRPPYDQLAAPLGWSTPWRNLFDAPATPAETRQFPYLRDWRARFDYVLVVGPRPPPAAPTPAALTLIRAGDESSLYQIER
jgi:hypothetical protein